MRDLGVAISGNGGGDGGGDTVGTAGGVNFPRLKFSAAASTIKFLRFCFYSKTTCI